MTSPGTNPKNLNSTSSAQAVEFVNSVLQLPLRTAVFDCDGTLWAGDSGEGFFDWELQQNLLSDEIVHWARPRYAAYKAGKVTEEQMCGEMVTMHRGLTEAEVQRAADRYFEQHCINDIFPELQVLVHLLQGAGCEVWAVSSTNEWVIRAGMRHFGIAEEKILAAAARVVDGKVTDQLVRIPTGEGKPKAIHQAIRRAPDAAFGNSIWDAAMLGIVRRPFVVNPTPQLQKIANERRWPVYFPDSVRAEIKDD
jgi:phosphoserine phosphatase